MPNISIEDAKVKDLLRMSRPPSGPPCLLSRNSIYRLSPRLVDFNTAKILSALFELDMEWESALDELSPREREFCPHAFVPFMQLILGPTSFGEIPNAEIGRGRFRRALRRLKSWVTIRPASTF
jgi:hypothetical protein